MRKAAFAWIVALTLLGMAIAPDSARAQELESKSAASVVTGTVRLGDGTPVPGAFISVRGQINSTVSDANGNYSIGVTGGFVILDAVAAVGGTAMHNGSAWILLPPGGGVVTADIYIQPSFPFPFPPIL